MVVHGYCCEIDQIEAVGLELLKPRRLFVWSTLERRIVVEGAHDLAKESVLASQVFVVEEAPVSEVATVVRRALRDQEQAEGVEFS